jgi:DNA-binding transcriptional MerR regulator
MILNLKETFTLKELQAVTGCGTEPLQTWVKRGFLTIEGGSTGSAHKRRYTLTHLFEVQLLLYLTDNGVRIELARQLLDNVLERARDRLARRALGMEVSSAGYWIVDGKRSYMPIIAEVNSDAEMRAFGGGRFDLEEMPPVAFIVSIDQIIERVISRVREIKQE